MPQNFSDAQILGKLAEEPGVGQISRDQIQQALADVHLLQNKFLDASDPHCLYPVASRGGDGTFSEECGKPATRDSHSIQRARSLREIASRDGRGNGRGLYVFQFFPDIDAALRRTSGITPDGRNALGQVWPWEITEIPPHSVTIDRASVMHFACNEHDQSTDALARADNLVVPAFKEEFLYLDERCPPSGMKPFMESLFVLAYRTLLHRISQYRGAEQAAAHLHMKRSVEGNRFAVKLIIEILSDFADRLTELYKVKMIYEQRILGVPEYKTLIHCIGRFNPTIRYTCAEYTPVNLFVRNRKTEVWLSMNVLLLEGVTWLIVSRPCQSSTVNHAIKNKVQLMLRNYPHQRRRTDFDLMCELVNLYASPDDYRNLSAEDQAEISSTVAQSVFRDTHSRILTLLRESAGGQAAIRRVEHKLLKRE